MLSDLGDVFIRFVVNLRVIDDDIVRHRNGYSLFACGVIGQHDLDLDSHDSLLEEHMPDSLVDIVILGLASGDHVALLELHALGSLLPQLAGNDHFTTLAAFHDH